MDPVEIVLQPRSAFANAQYNGNVGNLVAVPRYFVQAKIEFDGKRGEVTKITATLPDSRTPFQKIRNREVLIENLAPIFGIVSEGARRVGAVLYKVSNISVETEVNVRRRLNVVLAGRTNGPHGRPMAVPEFQARARTVVKFYVSGVKKWVKFGGDANWHPDGETAGGADDFVEPGPWGEIEYLTDAVGESIEPPQNAPYGSWEPISSGTVINQVTKKLA